MDGSGGETPIHPRDFCVQAAAEIRTHPRDLPRNRSSRFSIFPDGRLLHAPVERAWMTLARATSFVTTRIVMAVLYFGTITPVGPAGPRQSDRPARHEQRILEDAYKKGVPRTW